MLIDRDKLNKILDARDSLERIASVDIEIYPGGDFRLWVTPMTYLAPMSEEERHKVLAALTPLVGKIERKDETDYQGTGNGITVDLHRATTCKILGYKTVTKKFRKEIERQPEYEVVEEEVRVAITDCDVKAGRAKEDEIEVPA